MLRKAMLVILAVLLAALSSCADKEVIGAETKIGVLHAASPSDATIVLSEPEVSLSMDSLDDLTIEYLTNDGTDNTLAIDNFNGQKLVIYTRRAEKETVYEINKKGKTVRYQRRKSDEPFETAEFSDSDDRLDVIYKILNCFGIDWQEFLDFSNFVANGETDGHYIYLAELDGSEYEIYVDKSNGLWTKVCLEGDIEFEITDYTLRRAEIPSYK